MGLMMTHPYIDLASRRAADDTPEIPHTTLSDRQLARIGSEISLLRRAEEAERQRDMLAQRCAQQVRMIDEILASKPAAPMSAHSAWGAIKAKADLEGAIHADDVVAILRSMGAR